MNKALEADIFELEKKIEKRALILDDDLPETITKLRDCVLYVHRIAESDLFYHSVNIILERTTKDPKYTDENFVEWTKLMGDLSDYLNSLRSFKALFDFSKQFHAMPPELLEKIWKLNEIRNKLVHVKVRPHDKNEKWRIYEDRNNYHKVLVLCCEILDDLAKLEAWFEKVEKELMKK
ncbi:MAG: hypothetical protein WA061_05825 [Microgenomates group bacterium]